MKRLILTISLLAAATLPLRAQRQQTKTLTFDNGRYEGQVHKNLAHGQGTYYWNDGERYEGQWEEGQRNGFGIDYYPNGDRYEGNFVNNRKSGEGVYYWQSGDRYEGSFEGDRKSGRGLFLSASGNSYEGEWKKDVREGYGIFRWEEEPWKGDRYEGEWRDDKRNGQGIYYKADGKIEIGLFRDDRFVGLTAATPFSKYVKIFVEADIDRWQRRRDDESGDAWRERVNAAARQSRVDSLAAAAEQRYISDLVKSAPFTLTFGDYNASSQTATLISSRYGELPVAVPAAEIVAFKNNFGFLRKTPRYFIEEEKVALAEVTLTASDGKSYKYANPAAANPAKPQIDYEFPPLPEPETSPAADPAAGLAGMAGTAGAAVPEAAAETAGAADDIADVPQCGRSNPASFAVIIANGQYPQERDAAFALEDGRLVAAYCRQTLGLPEENIQLAENATREEMLARIEWLELVAAAYGGEVDLLFYYAGAGYADRATRIAYLLPADGSAADAATGYELGELLARLGAIEAQRITVVLDAGFGGTDRSGAPLPSVGEPAVRSRAELPAGRTILFAAAQGDETAFADTERRHGLFTYQLLKCLRESRGTATLGELQERLPAAVRQEAAGAGWRQNPVVLAAPQCGAEWQSKPLCGR